MKQLECHMIEPIRHLMLYKMSLDIVDREFSSGYGIADLVGAIFSSTSCRRRKSLGIETAFDDRLLVNVLMALRPDKRTSISYILSRVDIAKSTLLQYILPKLAKFGLIKRYVDGYVRALFQLPNPTKRIVAVEAKQTRWRDAILQARRYTFFANQTYIAVWDYITPLVDKSILYRYRLGLIAVEGNAAKIRIEAPIRNPRKAQMNCLCAEHLYKQTLG